MDSNVSTNPEGKSTQRILIRVDSSERIGSGHVSRCLRIAKELQSRGADVVFACAPLPGNASKEISDAGFAVYVLNSKSTEEIHGSIEAPWSSPDQSSDALATLEIVRLLNCSAVLIDHYAVGSQWEKYLTEQGLKVVALDDIHGKPHEADLVINPGWSRGSNSISPVAKPSKELSGLRYAIVSSEFCVTGRANRYSPSSKPRKVLIYFGGADLPNASERIVDSVLQSGIMGIKMELVLGPSNRHASELTEKYKSEPMVNIHGPVRNLAELMSECDLSIGAGGVTAFERVAASLPSLVFSISENQVTVCSTLHSMGASLYLGNFADFRESTFAADLDDFLENLSHHQKNLAEIKGRVDCLGPKRISEAILPSPQADLLPREAQYSDMLLYHDWVNDPLVRLHSLNTARIPLEEHRNWFFSKLEDPNTLMLVFEVNSLPVAQVRFTKNEGSWDLNYSLDEIVRGRGWAHHIVRLALEWVEDVVGSQKVTATVKKSNPASLNCLMKCGFIAADEPAANETVDLILDRI